MALLRRISRFAGRVLDGDVKATLIVVMMSSVLLLLFVFHVQHPVDQGEANLASRYWDIPSSREVGRSALSDAREGFQTRIVRQEHYNDEPPAVPPLGSGVDLVKYDSDLGQLSAYLTQDPDDGAKHPAIIWVTGGDTNTLDRVWVPLPERNEQFAVAFRRAGIVMMYPSLRGAHDNPGVREQYLGEVEDVIAAHAFLAKQRYVDPDRIYLGGHSSGGTLVLLVAESTDIFKAVFSFGPAADPLDYSDDVIYDAADEREWLLRRPISWLDDVRSPTYIIDGELSGSIGALRALEDASSNKTLRFFVVPGADHFSLLSPINELLADRIVLSALTSTEVKVAQYEISELFLPNSSSPVCMSSAGLTAGKDEYLCVAYWSYVLARHPDLPNKLDSLIANMESSGSRAEDDSGPRFVTSATIGIRGEVPNTIGVLQTSLELEDLKQIRFRLDSVPRRARDLGITIEGAEIAVFRGDRVVVFGDAPVLKVDAHSVGKQSITVFRDPGDGVRRLTIASFDESSNGVANRLFKYYKKSGAAGRGPPRVSVTAASPFSELRIKGPKGEAIQNVTIVPESDVGLRRKAISSARRAMMGAKPGGAVRIKPPPKLPKGIDGSGLSN